MTPRLLLCALFVGLLASASAQINDNFAGRLVLSGSHPTALANNLAATSEPGEPNHGANGLGRSLWWTWTAPGTGIYNVSTYAGSTGSIPPRVIAIYTGDAVAALTEIASTNNRNSSYYYDDRSSIANATLFAGGASVNLSAVAGTTYQIAVDARSSTLNSFSDDGTVVLSVNLPPTVACSASVNATVGAAFQQNVLASNGATAFTATNLPVGLGINAASGLISGTPTVKGNYAVALSATGPGGTGTATLTIQVNDPSTPVPTVPLFNGNAGSRGFVGQAFSYYLSASSTTTPTYTATNLPDGLTFSGQQISGLPTTAGTFQVPLTATNAAGTGTATLTISVSDLPKPPFLSGSLAISTTVGGSVYQYYYADSETNAGTVTFSATGLPPGLAMSTSGALTGTPTQEGVYSASVSATNGGASQTGIVTITVQPSSPVSTSQPAPPVLRSQAVVSGTAGTAFTYTLAASSLPTSFGASNLPAGLSLNSSTGVISGTPGVSGTFLVPVSATNASGTGTATLTINLATASGQPSTDGLALPLILSPASAVGNVGQSFSYTLGAVYGTSSYSGSGPWTFTTGTLPPGLKLSSSTSYGNVAISGTPTTAGTYPVNVSATLPAGYPPAIYPALTANATVTFVIRSSPAVSTVPFVGGSAGVLGSVGASLSYSSQISGSPTSYAASGLPPGLSISTSTGSISGTPTTAGTYQTTLSATNSAGTGSAVVMFLIAPQQIPLISSAGSVSGVVGTSFTYAINASGSNTAYGATNLPPGLSCNAAGTISGTPTTAGVYRVGLAVTNAAGTGTATLTLTVNSTANAFAPILTSYAVASGTVGVSFYYTLGASTSVTGYAASNLPPGLTLNASSGSISGTPTTVGTYLVPISATGTGGVSNATMTIIIAPAPLAILSSSGVTNQTVGQAFTYYLSATNSPTSYAASGLPTGLSLNTSTGTISGTVNAAGSYHVGVTAVSAAGTDNATLTINVNPLSAPVITSAAGVAGVVGSTLYYQVQTGGVATSYGISSVPAGLAFSSANGLLSGNPTSAGAYDLQITASNAVGTAQAAVRLVVTASIASTPTLTCAAEATATAGTAFSFGVYATNSPTGYGAANLPPGLSFASSTRLLSGTPTTPGIYAIPLTATNAAGSGSGTLTLVVSDPTLSAPALTPSNYLVYQTTVGGSASFSIYATNSPTGYAASGLPPGTSLNSSTGLISGTLTTPGNYPVTVSASNAAGTSASAVVTVLVVNGTIPAFTYTHLMADAYANVVYGDSSPYAVNSPTSYSADGLPAGLTLNSTSGSVSGIPTTPGRYPVTLSATNASGTGHAVWTVIVGDPQTLKPNLDGYLMASASLGVGASFYTSFGVNTTDGTLSPGLPLTFSYVGLPPGITGSATGTSSSSYAGTLSGTPTLAGVYPITITATTPAGASASTVLTAVVGTPPPYLSSAASVAGNENTPITAYALTSYPAAKSYSAGTLPPGLALNVSTGYITGTPTTAGTYTTAVTATGATGTASGVLTFQIGPPLAGGLPIITSAASAGYQDGASSYYNGTTAFGYTITALNSPIGFAATGLPAGLSLNPYSGYISGDPVANGTYKVAIQATNAVGSAQATLTIVVTGSLPVLTASLGTYGYLNGSLTYFIATSAIPYSGYYVSSSSVADSLTYAASGLPPGLSVNTFSGNITGTTTQLGVYPVVLSVTNRAGTATCITTFAVSVAPPAVTTVSPPSFYGQIVAAGTVGQSLSYFLSGGGARSYTALNLPAGLSLDSTNGLITGTPTTAGSFLVPVSATNEAGTAQATLTVQVASTGRAPYVQSSLAMNATLGRSFYENVSSDYYTGSLLTMTYTAGDLPAGLTFNPQDGSISGVPTGPVGTFPVPVSITRGGLTCTAVLTLNVVPPTAPLNPLTVSSSDATLGLTGYPLSYTIIDAAFAPTTALPAGLSFDPATGILFGVPGSSGIYQLPLATTAANGDRHAVVTLNIVDPTLASPRLTSQPIGGTVLQNGSFGLAASAVGVPSPVYQWYHNGLPVAGATNATLTLQTVQPADTGTYTLTAANLAGSVTSRRATVLVQQSFAAWQGAHFTGAEIAAGLAADGADPDGDGVVNLLEYALGTNPHETAVNGLPTALYSTSSNGLRFSFVRDSERVDLNYVVEASADLQSWTVVAESDAGAPMTTPGNASTVTEQPVIGTSQTTVTVQVSQNAGTLSGRFMRLRIGRNQ